MKLRTQSGAFINALRAIIPAADIGILHERPWHSLTFSGTQIGLSVQMQDGAWHGNVGALLQMLAEYEFDMPRQIVADIAVTGAVMAKNAQCLIIDALLLDSLG
ncbi:hypothetical protein [Sphingorhabdus sp.]|jgi:hypothetical protein|uniref:hypothetical protein n=1 Tax=Sphingorhabdus sp. TaxID=1902408 RepID=UPI002FD99149